MIGSKKHSIKQPIKQPIYRTHYLLEIQLMHRCRWLFRLDARKQTCCAMTNFLPLGCLYFSYGNGNNIYGVLEVRGDFRNTEALMDQQENARGSHFI